MGFDANRHVLGLGAGGGGAGGVAAAQLSQIRVVGTGGVPVVQTTPRTLAHVLHLDDTCPVTTHRGHVWTAGGGNSGDATSPLARSRNTTSRIRGPPTYSTLPVVTVVVSPHPLHLDTATSFIDSRASTALSRVENPGALHRWVYDSLGVHAILNRVVHATHVAIAWVRCPGGSPKYRRNRDLPIKHGFHGGRAITRGWTILSKPCTGSPSMFCVVPHHEGAVI